MKKTWKRVLAGVCAATMVFTSVNVSPAITANAATFSSGDEWITTANGLSVKITATYNGESEGVMAGLEQTGTGYAESTANIQHVVDGDDSTGVIFRQSFSGYNNDWLAENDYIQVEFEEAITFNGATFKFDPNNENDVYNASKFSYTTDGSTWNELGAVESAATMTYTASEGIANVKAIRLTNTVGEKSWVRLMEIAVDAEGAAVILNNISVTAPTKTEYFTGEEFDATGMVVTASYSDGSTAELTADDYTVSGFDSKTAGTKTITVTYGEKTATFTVNVVEKGSAEDGSNDVPISEYAAATAGSTQSGNDPVNAIDGNEDSYWEVAWGIGGTNPELLWYQIELKEETELDALRYLPRWGNNPQGGSANGFITAYRIEVSTNGETYETAAEGTWNFEEGWKIAKFDKAVTAKYVKLVATGTFSATGDNMELSAVEFRVRAAADEEPEMPTIEVSENVQNMINSMTLRDKVTQMLMVDFRDWDSDLTDNVAKVDFTVMNEQVQKIVEDYNFGALIYFADNIKETEQSYNLTMAMQEAATKDGGIPLLISADQEGGSVYRLGSGTALPGNMALGATFDTENAKLAGQIIGRELSVLGINTNLAPVVDVNNNANNPVIGLRSYGDDATAVGQMAAASIEGMAEYNVIGCAKHFPGHGDTATDSHYGLPVVDKTYDVLKDVELKPYEVAIEKGIEMIMTAHILYPKLESDKILSAKTGVEESLPATMSDDILTGLLKGEMGFEGIICTDAMNMKGISDKWDQVQSVKIAIQAGVDMICMPCQLSSTDDLQNLDAIINGVVAAVENGEISEARINDAVGRILTVKENREILSYNAEDYSLEEAKEEVGSDENRQIEREIAAKAVTVVKNTDNVLPLNITEDTNVLMLVPYDNERAQMLMAWNRAVEARIIPEEAEVDYYRFSNSTTMETAALVEKLEWADVVIINSEISSTGSNRMEYGYWLSNIPNEVTKYCAANDKISVISSVDKPYDVQLYPAADAIVAAYGCKGSTVDPTEAIIGGVTGSEAAYGPNIIAAVEVILGTYGAQGKLPVNIPVYDADTNEYSEEIAYERGYGLTYDAKEPLPVDKAALVDAITAAEELVESGYTAESWATFADALAAAVEVNNNAEATQDAVDEAVAALASAVDGLVYQFTFPSELNASATLEAEYATLYNSGGDDEEWKLVVEESDWASNNKFVNCLNRGDSISIAYVAEVAGTYSVTVTYRSGSAANYLEWSEANDKITAGTALAGNDDAEVTKTVTFDMVVEEAGAGVLTFAPTTADSPQLDKFDIVLTEVPVDKSALEAAITATETLVEANYTEESWTAFELALAEAVAANESEDISQVEVDAAVEALTTAQGALELKGANYGEVDAAIERANALDADDYKDFTGVTNAIAAVVRDKKITEQAEVDAMAKAINDAIDALEEVEQVDPTDDTYDVPVSKYTETAGSTQPGNSPGLATDNNTNTYWEVRWGEGQTNFGNLWYQIELDEAIEIQALRYYPRFGEDYATQGTANGFITAYRVEVSMDGTNWETVATGTWALEAGWKIAEFDEPVTAKYVKLVATGTFADIGNNSEMSIAEIRVKATTEIADTAELEAAIAEAESLTEANYTTASWAALQTEVAEANAVLNKDVVTQAEVDQAAEELEAALTALVDKSELATAVAEANALVEADYAAANWAAFQTAVDAAEAVLAKENATQSEINAAVDELAAAKAALVNKEVLEAAIADAEKLSAGDYTEESWSKFAAALSAAKEVNRDADATQVAVDKAVDDLAEATQTLEEKVVNPFEDVKESDYYYDEVLWAYNNNITKGTSETTFSPGEPCTRGQIVTFLWNAAGRPEAKDTSNPFEDVDPEAYYYKAVLWAVENNITAGTSETTFSPDEACTRGQIVTFLWNAQERPEVTSTENPFEDVVEGTYYYQAILWAVENELAYGVEADTFSPDEVCTRGQIVTFLYRYCNKQF